MASLKRRIVGSKFIPATTIVVLVLNEADNILPLVKRVRTAIASRKVELLFIDDSPNTKTVHQIKLAQSKYVRKNFDIRFYHRTGKKKWGGLSGSVVDGINRARCERIIVMDGDLQHPPESLPGIIRASSSKDMVVASRYCKGGSAQGLDGGIRHLISCSSTLLAKMFFPRRLRSVSDPMTGFFLVNRQKLDLHKLQPKGFKILLEILATHPKLTVTEIPLQFATRTAGTSKGNLSQGLKFLSQLINLRFRRIINILSRLPKSILFGLIGGTVFGIGMVLLYVFVEILGWSPLLSNAVQLVVTFWLNFLLNRHITWRERTISRLATHKFLISRVITTGLNYALFVWLISQHSTFTIYNWSFNFSINYIVANFITLMIIMVINYIVSDRWVFAEPKQISTRTVRRQTHRSASPSIFLILLLIGVIDFGLGFNSTLTLSALMVMISLILLVQSCIEVWRFVYAYRDPDSIDRLRFPLPKAPKENFCIIVPARHEESVLGSTLSLLAKQTHPNVTIITVICDDDVDTLQVAYTAAAREPRIQVMVYPLSHGVKPSKPKQLNFVFNQISHGLFDIIGIIDAEDTVHPELLLHVDTAFRDRKIGIVQGGVQLMDHDSSWYSLHNVLEYYRWYSSTMVFQADMKFMPLGGNTVFIRNNLLKRAGGWPETLTEDCSLGVLLSARYQTTTAVYYEPWLATREETPGSLKALFKQRVRWHQGFFHEWRKGVWQELPYFKQRLLADYVLISPVLMFVVSLIIPISLVATLFLNAPVILVLLMFLPLIPASLLLVINTVMLHDFGEAFERKILSRQYATLILTQILYQLVLNAAAFWAVLRELRGDQTWYKTPHTGAHRIEPAFLRAESSPIHLIAEEASDA